MNRTTALLLLCAAGVSGACSQAAPDPGTGNTAGATSTGGSTSGGSGNAGAAPVAGAAGATTAGAPGSAGSAGAGGSVATGGSGGGTGGSGGSVAQAGSGGAVSSAGAAGSGVTVESIVPTLDGYVWVGSCGDATSTTKDCPMNNDTGAACVTGTADFYALGAFKTKSHTVGGTPGTKYMITFEARGVTGGKNYNAGTRQSTDTGLSQTANDGWYKGGLPTPSKWNTYEIHVTPPVPGEPVNTQKLTCTGCPTPPDNVYYTNSIAGNADGTHETFPIKFNASFPVMGGGTITLVIHDSNCLAQQNCGSNPDQAAMCTDPRSVDLTGLSPLPAFAQPYTQAHNPQPWHPQWLVFDVKSVTQQ